MQVNGQGGGLHFPFFTTVAQVSSRATVDGPGPAAGVTAVSDRQGAGVSLGGALDTVSALTADEPTAAAATACPWRFLDSRATSRIVANSFGERQTLGLRF